MLIVKIIANLVDVLEYAIPFSLIFFCLQSDFNSSEVRFYLFYCFQARVFAQRAALRTYLKTGNKNSLAENLISYDLHGFLRYGS